MQKENDICRQFETEVWLYISGEMEETRLASWNDHLNLCSKCSELLKSNKEISAVYRENFSADLLDASFNRIIENATAAPSFLQKVKTFFTINSKDYIFGKIAVASGLLTAAVLMLVLTNRPNPVKETAAVIFKWDDTEITAKINEISNAVSVLDNNTSVNENNFRISVKGIGRRIDSLKQKINL